MKIQSIKLSNGFNIVHIEQKNSEVVSMILLGKAGSSFEKVPGTAHLLEHVAMCGSEKYPDKKQLASIVRNSGGHTNGMTGKEFTEYTIKIVKPEAERGFEFLSQVVFHPLIKDINVKKEKKIVFQEYKRALSNNQRQLFETMIGAAYKSKPMRRMVLGDEVNIKKIDTKELRTFWTKYYTINNFVLCICGNIDKKTVKKLAEKYFGDLSSKNKKILPNHQLSESAGINVLHRENINQARMMLSFPAPPFSSKEHYTALLISYILGRGGLSKLYQSIREKNQLAYDISSWIWKGYGYSLFFIEAGISENKINEALTLISRELKEISNKILTLEELSMFKKQARSFLLFSFEDSLQMATYHARHYHLFPKTTNYKYEYELEKIFSVTPKEITQTATRMFSKKPTFSVLAEKIEKKDIDLKPLL
ncbi:MAG: pitrilysin family protein [Patescibacteria group bacterium]|nr:insulinase family protein [Patescibacteria group bacterium]